MIAAAIKGRGLTLAALVALVLVLVAGPGPAAPSLMQERLVQAMLMGAGPDDLCGMEGEAGPVHCAACLPLLAGLLPDLPVVPRPLRHPGADAVSVPNTPPALRPSGPGVIRGPPQA